MCIEKYKCCLSCRVDLTKKQIGKKYVHCSPGCRDLTKLRNPIIPWCMCGTCRRVFKPISKDRMQYCSKRCSYIDNMGKPIKDHWLEKSCKVFFKECDECGDVFTAKDNRRICCEGCFKARQAKGYKAKAKVLYHQDPRVRAQRGIKIHTKICIICGNGFDTYRLNQKCCSDQCMTENEINTQRIIKSNSNQRRRARLRGATIERFTKEEIFIRDSWRCKLCGKKLKPGAKFPHPLYPTIDHIVPLSKGGQHTRLNVQAACFICNSMKGDSKTTYHEAGPSTIPLLTFNGR